MALVQSAIKKHRAGQKLSRQETTAWKRFEREEDQRRGLRFVETVPKSLYCEWSGRQTKILHDEADLYGMPLRGSTINLPELIRWLHNFLAQHKHELPGLVKEGAAGDGHTLSLKEQLNQEKLTAARLQNEDRAMMQAVKKRQLVPTEVLHEKLGLMGKMLRSCGEQLYKRHGQEAGDVLSATLENFLILLDELVEETAPEPNTPAGAVQSESESPS